MTLTGRVFAADGSALAGATVEVVSSKGAGLSTIGRGTVDRGVLSAEAEEAPVWGLRIDGQPVVATVASFDGQIANVGEIVLVSRGIAWPMFHAADGLVFGTPRVARATAIGETTAPRLVATRAGLSFGGLLGSTAQQLNSVVTSTQGLQLTNANVTIKGLPVATEEAIGLEFPNAELAASGTGLSEVSFTVKPLPPPPVPPQPSGPAVPDLRGYTRDLAVRKLTALHFVAEVRDEITADRARVGRVMRQIPAAGQPASTVAVVQLFVGKLGA